MLSERNFDRDQRSDGRSNRDVRRWCSVVHPPPAAWRLPFLRCQYRTPRSVVRVFLRCRRVCVA
jgi:hypothetical protein